MAKDNVINIYTDAGTKKAIEALYAQFGITVSDAVNIFFRKSLKMCIRDSPCPATLGELYPLHGPSKNAGPWIASSAILVPLRFWQSESVPTQGIQFAQGSRAGRQGRAAGTGCFNFYLFRKIYRCELPPDMVLFMEKNFLGILTEM